jgi:hypothetical protein
VAWRQLNQQTLVKVVQKFAAQFGQKLTKKKLGQFVPIAGVGIGAALNWKMVDDVANAAYWAYRQRSRSTPRCAAATTPTPPPPSRVAFSALSTGRRRFPRSGVSCCTAGPGQRPGPWWRWHPNREGGQVVQL